MCIKTSLVSLASLLILFAAASLSAQPMYFDNMGDGWECIPTDSPYFADSSIFVDVFSPTIVSFNFWNVGDELLEYTVSINYLDGDGWISPDPAAGSLTHLGGAIGQIDLYCTAPDGANYFTYWQAEIVITHNGPDSPRIIPICVYIIESYPGNFVNLPTACHDLRIFDDGQLVDGSSGNAFDFNDDCDTFNLYTQSDIYLAGGTPLLCRIVDDDTLRFQVYNNWQPLVDGFVPTDVMTYDETTYADFTYLRTDVTTADFEVGVITEYFAPKGPENCHFIIQKFRFFNRTDATLTGILPGCAHDWDIPSDTSFRNGSGFNLPLDAVFQQGVEYNQDDDTEALCPQESDDRFGGMALPYGYKNAQTLGVLEYLATSPYPLPPGKTYRAMHDVDGINVYSSAHPDSQYIDLFTLVTFADLDLNPGDTITYVAIMAVSKEGFADFAASLEAGETFIAEHPEFFGPSNCCDIPGDANDDGSMNVGDAVYLINFAFKGGPAPPCPNEGDANGDCSINVGDAVAIIQSIFKPDIYPPIIIMCGPDYCDYGY